MPKLADMLARAGPFRRPPLYKRDNWETALGPHCCLVAGLHGEERREGHGERGWVGGGERERERGRAALWQTEEKRESVKVGR